MRAGGLSSLTMLRLLSQAAASLGGKSNTITVVPCLDPRLTRKSIIAGDAVRRQRSAACIKCIEGASS